jgi:hypothetical protein
MTRSPVARGLLAKFYAARQAYRVEVVRQLYSAGIDRCQNGAFHW